MKKIILIAEYDCRWPAIYQREKQKILAVIRAKIQAIEHIGSTAVIGLAAKPVIDIMIAIKDLSLTSQLIELLGDIGYKYVPEYEVSLPERRFFHKGPQETTGSPNRHFHMHIVEENSQFWITHILFRDYLVNHPNAIQEYADLKKKLSLASDGNIDDYCDGKSDFIKNIISLAKSTA